MNILFYQNSHFNEISVCVLKYKNKEIYNKMFNFEIKLC